MISYNKLYLADAIESLSGALDYAINDCHFSPKDFSHMFVSSKYCRLFETGNPWVISGMSGIELVQHILEDNQCLTKFPKRTFSQSRSPEFWAGDYLAYYQWYSGRKFEDIFRKIPLEEIIDMYTIFHEMDYTNFVEAMEIKYQQVILPTKLKTIRETRGFSQSELAKASGVTLRMIQLYEQKVKDIDKAQAKSLDKLARALGCHIEDLLENN